MLEDLADEKQAHPGGDLVSGLISARDGDERLSTEEMLSTIFQLIVAGHDHCEPDRQRRRRPAPASRAARRPAIRSVRVGRRRRGAPPLRRARPLPVVPGPASPRT
jgi:hypothetical protein